MSLFKSLVIPCPSCGDEIRFEAVHSVNADRRPDFRQAILDGSFQRELCPACGESFRLEPEMTYLDLGRKQWILVRPPGDLVDWTGFETQARSTWALSFGDRAGSIARRLGEGVNPRITFGWAGLREKLLCAEHGIDDTALELTKLLLIRAGGSLPIDDDTELRLASVEDDALVLAWVRARGEELIESLRVDRSLLDDTRAADLEPLREALTDGMYVDMNRLLVA